MLSVKSSRKQKEVGRILGLGACGEVGKATRRRCVSTFSILVGKVQPGPASGNQNRTHLKVLEVNEQIQVQADQFT